MPKRSTSPKRPLPKAKAKTKNSNSLLALQQVREAYSMLKSGDVAGCSSSLEHVLFDFEVPPSNVPAAAMKKSMKSTAKKGSVKMKKKTVKKSHIA